VPQIQSSVISQPPGLSGLTLRQASTFNTHASPLRVYAKRAIMLANDQVVREIRQREVTIPAGLYSTVTIIPIAETIVIEGNVGRAGSAYCKYIFEGPHGHHPAFLALYHRRFAASGENVEFMRLQHVVFDMRKQPTGAVIGGNYVGNVDAIDGVTVTGSNYDSAALFSQGWMELEPQFHNLNVDWFMVVTANIEPQPRDYHLRLEISLGSGEDGSQVDEVRADFPIAPQQGTDCTNIPVRYTLGCDMTAGVRWLRVRLLYPPYFSAGQQVTGSFQVYGYFADKLVGHKGFLDQETSFAPSEGFNYS